MNHAQATYSATAAVSSVICNTAKRRRLIARVRAGAIDAGIIWCRENILRRYRTCDLAALPDNALHALDALLD
jgi:hypothetical protein